MTINQAFILAAGQGKRMRPLTNDIPKPLVKINGVTMLDCILENLKILPQINKIVINGFYLAEKIEHHITLLKNEKIYFSKEAEALETGGGLLQAMEIFDSNKPILIINGDIVFKGNALKFLVDNFDSQKMDILLGLKAKESFLGYEGNGDFNLNDGNLTKSAENDFVYCGLQILHPRILQNRELPKAPFSLNYFFKDSQEKSIRLKGIELPGKFFHIGTVADLEKYSPIID